MPELSIQALVESLYIVMGSIIHVDGSSLEKKDVLRRGYDDHTMICRHVKLVASSCVLCLLLMQLR